MQIGGYKFNRVEFAGSLGDLGTLIPFTLALIIIAELSVTSVLLMIGFFYIIGGIYYKLPIPVQPLKVVSAIAIANPEKISLSVISASGILFGIILLILAFTGLIDWLSKFFTKPVMRGIQLGLGFILINKGIGFVLKNELFIHKSSTGIDFTGVPLNLIIGIIGFLIALLLLSNKRFPAAIILLLFGVAAGICFGSLNNIDTSFGPTRVNIVLPQYTDFFNALILLVIPQIPLTLGNAVMGTSDTCYTLFGKGDVTKKATPRAFASSMGFINIITGFIGAMPMCHGAGGLAAHYRFGARTGGSNIMIGLIFMAIGLFLGKTGISILSSIPNSILGVLLIFAGIELALMIKDITDKKDLFVAILIAGIGFTTTNMGIAFFSGIITLYLIKWFQVKI